MNLFILLSFLLLYIAPVAFADDNRDLFAFLIDKIEKLELNDIENKREISSMKMEFKKRESYLQNQIDLLSRQINKQEVPQTLVGQKDANKREIKPSIVRRNVELEVAFYATHSQHDVQHLGAHEIIVFDSVVTNVGNAYNPHLGGFVAPVDGTYVFHVTMMGKDVPVTINYYNAYIDVDGVRYSEFWVVPYEQSSHMFVKELKAGSTVSVKNNRVDDGFIGQHFSAFSGFLLYQHFSDPGVVGK